MECENICHVGRLLVLKNISILLPYILDWCIHGIPYIGCLPENQKRITQDKFPVLVIAVMCEYVFKDIPPEKRLNIPQDSTQASPM
jgi:hypothetical protein